MPATRSRSSTETAAVVASEDVKQVAEDTPVVDAPVVAEEVTPSEAEAVPAEVPVPSEPVPVVEEPVVAPVVETNGTSEAVAETNGNGVADVVEPVIESEAVDAKRKSEVGGEGDGPDSTEAAAPVKKVKVDEDVPAEEAVPVVEASV